MLQTGTVLFRARNVGSFAVMRDLRTAGTRAVLSERLKWRASTRGRRRDDRAGPG